MRLTLDKKDIMQKAIDLNKCPVCEFPAKVEEFDYKERLRVECPACGNFVITRHTLIYGKRSKVSEWRSLLSYWLANRENREQEVDNSAIRIILKEVQFPGYREQQDQFILWLGSMLNHPADKYPVFHNINIAAAKIGAVASTGIDYLIEYLEKSDYIYIGVGLADHPEGGGANMCGLTPAGWNKFEELKRSGTSGRLAFMAMQYGNALHDDIFKKCFKKAVQETGFGLKRLDENLPAGLIDNHMRVQIRNSRFLLADLSGGNRGAYWEAGYAEGLGMPVIYLCEKKEFSEFKTHFDTNHHTTVLWEESALEKAAADLKSTIRASLPLEAKLSDKNEPE